MKLKSIMVAPLAIMSTSGAYADTDSGTIHFDSEVTSATCTLEASQHAIASIIPDVSVGDINETVGGAFTAKSADFTLNFTGCPGGTSNINIVDVTSSGSPSLDDANTLVIPEGGSAKGIAVGTEINDQKVNLGKNTNSSITAPVDGNGAASLTGSNFVTNESTITTAPGDYNTTFTLTFDWT